MTLTPLPAESQGSPSERLTRHIAALCDWRGETLAGVRRLIHEAEPDIREEWKWQKATSPGTPVWSHGGGVCTGEVYRQTVKLTFFRGAALADPQGLFNASLTGGTRRAIDLHEGEALDPEAFRALVRAAVAANRDAQAGRAGRRKAGSAGDAD